MHRRAALLAALGPPRAVVKWLTVLAVAVVLLLTLTPVPGGQTGLWRRCFICGERGVADMIDNVILFAPLATGLLLLGQRWSRVIGLAAGLSLCIEIVQVVVPGRDPSPVDVLFNSLGAVVAAGVILLAAAAVERDERGAARAAIVAAGLFGCMVAGTGLLLSPGLPDSIYYGQWTPSLGRLEQYEGSVVSATVGEHPIPPMPFPNRVLRDDFLAGEPLAARVVAGPPPSGLAPIVSVYDEFQRRILFIAADQEDLVFHLRTRAASLALDEAGLRVGGAFRSITPGDTVLIRARRRPAGLCVAVGGAEQCTQSTASDGWVALYSLERSSPGFRRLVGMIWMAMLSMPVGAFLRSRRRAVIPVALMVLSLSVLPPLVGLGATAISGYGAAAVGMAAGAACAAMLRRRGRGRRRGGAWALRGA